MPQADLKYQSVSAMEITLDIRPETLHRFMVAHADLTNYLGYTPPLEWFMAHALDASDPADLEKTLRRMGQNYLRNRSLFE